MVDDAYSDHDDRRHCCRCSDADADEDNGAAEDHDGDNDPGDGDAGADCDGDDDYEDKKVVHDDHHKPPFKKPCDCEFTLRAKVTQDRVVGLGR